MANVGLGVTIGNHALRAIKLRRKGEQFIVQRVFSDRLDEETRSLAGRALAARGMKGAPATVGLTGRDVIIRYTQIPPVPDWRLRTLMKFEVEEVSSQSGGDVSADYRKLELPDLDGERADDTILVALTRNRHLDTLLKGLESGGLKMHGGTPNSVALFNAFAVNATYTEDETALLVNIGGDNVDMALQQGGELLFARNATPGGTAFTEAIKQAFGTSVGKAEKMKKTKGDVTPKGQAKYPDPTSEKVANAIIGTAGQLSSMIQSTLMIARAQTRTPDLKVDRVLLAGGGASLKGLDAYLQQSMGIPVERFDPFDLCDLSQLSDEERALIEQAPHEFAVAMGLAQNDMSPAAFTLSVLPEAQRRVRDFMTKGIWAAAAAVVMLGVLFLIYQGRGKSAEAFQSKRDQVSREIRRAQGKDSALRKALSSVQGVEVKHKALAEQAAPAALLGRVMAELQENVVPHIYLHTVKLGLNPNANTFPYYVPKGSKMGSGYDLSTRTAPGSINLTREPYVTVQGRISGGQNPARIYEEFAQACLNNKRGLDVDTVQRFKPGRSGQDGRFELIFRRGTELRPATEEGRKVVLGRIALEGEDEEDYVFTGRRADGVLVRVPAQDVERKQREELIAILKEKNPPQPDKDDDGN